MKYTIIIFLAVSLTACTAAAPGSNITQDMAGGPAEITDTPLPTTQNFTSTNTPTQTPNPTATSIIQVDVLDSPEIDLVATALNYQIDEYAITLTAAADTIATLNAAIATQQVAATSSPQQGSLVVSGFTIPPDVNVATIIDDAFLEITRQDNPNGAPIMQQYQPQIHLYPGTQTFVYADPVTADGGGKYYLVYDPDGETIEDFYLRGRDIQIKLRTGTPSPFDYPPDVVKARPTSNVIAYYIYGYDDNNKPIMEAFQPRITYGAGDTMLIHGTRVVATGNMIFFAVYDPDGQSSIYVVGEKLQMLNTWD